MFMKQLAVTNVFKILYTYYYVDILGESKLHWLLIQSPHTNTHTHTHTNLEGIKGSLRESGRKPFSRREQLQQLQVTQASACFELINIHLVYVTSALNLCSNC